MTSSLKDAILAVMFIALVAVVGYLAGGYGSGNLSLPLDITEGSLVLPTEVQTTVGIPVPVRADTRGKRVVWMPLERDLQVVPGVDNKSVWVSAAKAGEYHLTAWTAVNNLPTTNVTTTIKVGATIVAPEPKIPQPEDPSKKETPK